MHNHICPWWMGYFLASPLRKLRQNPQTILSSYIRPGMTAVDYGCAMGFFSIPLALMTAPGGRVICVDVQEKMLRALLKKARRRKLDKVIEPRLASDTVSGLEDIKNQADFALAFAVVHEVPDPSNFFASISEALKKGAYLLFAEPSAHVSRAEFEKTLSIAEKFGLIRTGEPKINLSHSALLVK